MALVYGIVNQLGMEGIFIHRSEKGSISNFSTAGPTPCSPATDLWGCPHSNYHDDIQNLLVQEFLKGELPYPDLCHHCPHYKKLEFVNEIRDIFGLELLKI